MRSSTPIGDGPISAITVSCVPIALLSGRSEQSFGGLNVTRSAGDGSLKTRAVVGSISRSSSSHKGSSPAARCSSSARGGHSTRPRLASRAVTICSGCVTSTAPSRISALVPSARGSRGDPGTAKTSRFCSKANLAVAKLPDLSPASITTVATAKPEIKRLR